MRNFTASFILIVVVAGLTLNFMGGMFNSFSLSSKAEKDVKDLKEKVDNQGTDVGKLKNRSQKLDEGPGGGLTNVLGFVFDTVGKVANIPSMASLVVSKLNLPIELVLLASIPVAYAIWEIVSIYFSIRT